MPVIPLVPSDSPALIFSLLRLSTHHLALVVSALQPPKICNSLPLPLRTCTVPDTFRRHLRPTIASRLFDPLTHFCAQLLLTIVLVYKLYLLTSPSCKGCRGRSLQFTVALFV